ncbi:hypothetical protein [Roseiterribacter gracilis]|uniref:Uncharacterized protein n=1 Tax=Roseiterribacter gracilis TaxID=2812848 RepID=A0A8S8XEN3_9PROT|nr:hypothetical protein TMPK1_26160 [Rhodospirillales bacterium TMPK1]
MASQRARILAAADGSLPIPFGASGTREALLIGFVAAGGNWVGSFARGTTDTGLDAALHDVGPITVVIASGTAYFVDREAQLLVHAALPGIDAVLTHADGSLTLSDGSFLHTIARDCGVTRSARIAWNGIRALCEIDGVIHGEAYSARDRGWSEFQLPRADNAGQAKRVPTA